ncbi:MAG TPA: hypothetical protein VNE62_10645 [Actinomycetota bacterium]|nr:hypothetical protein [Actinomycetota bacterium]
MAQCLYCGVLASDPQRGPSDWARAVVRGEQVLVCPGCQRLRPEWTEEAEDCPVCRSKRLSKALGDKVCRKCGHQWSEESFSLD